MSNVERNSVRLRRRIVTVCCLFVCLFVCLILGMEEVIKRMIGGLSTETLNILLTIFVKNSW